MDVAALGAGVRLDEESAGPLAALDAAADQPNQQHDDNDDTKDAA
jgi:hypothetical protein